MCSRKTQSNDAGAVMLIAVFFAVFALALRYTTVGTAETVLFRERMQDAADATALSSAVMHARSMNLLVLINIVMAVLLAILVTIKLLEALAILGIAIAAGLAVPTFGASLAAIPPLKVVQAKMHAAYEQFKPPIDTALETLHDTADAVTDVAPGAANALATQDLDAFWKPPVDSGFVVAKPELPVEDDEYKELCEKAGELPAKIAAQALPVGGEVFDALSEPMGDMAREFSSWFCGDPDESPPTFERKEKVAYPRLETTERCREETLSGATEMSAEAAETELCTQSRLQELAADPDARGSCKNGSDCSLQGPYEERVARARVDCDPTSTPHPLKYTYQERIGHVRYVWTGEFWKREEPRYESPARRDSNQPPCGPASVKPTVAEGYNVVVRHSDDVREVQPVCSTEQPPELPRFLLKEGYVQTVTFTEVRHILGCEKQETIKAAVKDDRAGGDGGSTRSPKRIQTDVSLGDEHFQIRAVLWGDLQAKQAGRVVRLALWNTKEANNPLSGLEPFKGFAVAQAEYFFDGNDGQDAWMWNMKWRARLRRFRLGNDGAIAAVRGACVDRGGDMCGHFVDWLMRLDGLIAH